MAESQSVKIGDYVYFHQYNMNRYGKVVDKSTNGKFITVQLIEYRTSIPTHEIQGISPRSFRDWLKRWLQLA